MFLSISLHILPNLILETTSVRVEQRPRIPLKLGLLPKEGWIVLLESKFPLCCCVVPLLLRGTLLQGVRQICPEVSPAAHRLSLCFVSTMNGCKDVPSCCQLMLIDYFGLNRACIAFNRLMLS